MTYKKKRPFSKLGRSLFVGIALEHYFHGEAAIEKVIVHAFPVWWSRGESIKSRCRSVEPSRTALIRVALNWFDSHLTNKNTAPKGGVFIGGAEGNRTPVRKQLGRNFSGRSLLFTFPHPDGNKHPAGISSFIMHGRRKALPAHVLYSDHTRARLVDLPGRMGA